MMRLIYTSLQLGLYTRLMNICSFYVYTELIKNNSILEIKADLNSSVTLSRSGSSNNNYNKIEDLNVIPKRVFKDLKIYCMK